MGEVTVRVRPAAAVTVSGGLLLAAGSFLPWMKATAPLVGTVTRSGMEAGAGVYTLAAGVAVVVCGFVAGGRRAAAVVAIVVGCVAAAIVAHEFADLSQRVADMTQESVLSSLGAGLWLCGLGAVAAAVGGALAVTE